MLTFGQTVKYCSLVTVVGFLFGLGMSDGSIFAASSLASAGLMASYASVVTTEVLYLFVITLFGNKNPRSKLRGIAPVACCLISLQAAGNQTQRD